MSPEEQLQVADTLALTLKDGSSEVRKEALSCLIALGLDGLSRIIDVIDDTSAPTETRKEAVEALGSAFSEGRVDKTGMIREAIVALEKCLKNDNPLCEAAVTALGEIGTQAISTKPRIMALLNESKDINRICVKSASALLKISPVH